MRSMPGLLMWSFVMTFTLIGSETNLRAAGRGDGGSTPLGVV